MSEFKIGDNVRVVSVVPMDGKNGVRFGDSGVVKCLYGDSGVYVDFGREIKTGTWTSSDGAYVMWDSQLERVRVDIPVSPFYVRAELGYSYKVDVDGLYFSLTSLETGRHWPNHAEASKIPGFFSEGRWKLIDPPAAYIVATATAEVQRLLREQADAKAECDRIDAEQAKAEEKRRNIGKALSEARVALEKANHDAAGVKFDCLANNLVIPVEFSPTITITR